MPKNHYNDKKKVVITTPEETRDLHTTLYQCVTNIQILRKQIQQIYIHSLKYLLGPQIYSDINLLNLDIYLSQEEENFGHPLLCTSVLNTLYSKQYTLHSTL